MPCVNKLFLEGDLVHQAWSDVYLEGQVLEEVCGAICLCCFCSRTSINPHANGGGLGVGRVLGGHGQAILESSGLGLDGGGDGSRKGAPQWGRRERPPGEALVEVESESPRGHRGRVGDVPIAFDDSNRRYGGLKKVNSRRKTLKRAEVPCEPGVEVGVGDVGSLVVRVRGLLSTTENRPEGSRFSPGKPRLGHQHNYQAAIGLSPSMSGPEFARGKAAA